MKEEDFTQIAKESKNFEDYLEKSQLNVLIKIQDIIPSAKAFLIEHEKLYNLVKQDQISSFTNIEETIQKMEKDDLIELAKIVDKALKNINEKK